MSSSTDLATLTSAVPAEQVGSSAALVQAAIAEVQVAQLVALRNKRDELHARTQILAACGRPLFAKAGIYSKPVAGKRMEGLSIRFMEEALRCWGNCKVQAYSIEDSAERVGYKMVAWDLETGFSQSEDVIVKRRVERKNPAGRNVVGPKEGRLNSEGERVYLVEALDAEVETTLRAKMSICKRNLARCILPADLREEAEQAMRSTIKGEIKADPAKAAKDIADAFATIGVTPKSLAEYLGHPVGESSPVEIEDLRIVYTSVKDGETTFSEVLAHRLAEGNGEVVDVETGQVTPAKPSTPKARVTRARVTTRAKEGEQQQAEPPPVEVEPTVETEPRLTVVKDPNDTSTIDAFDNADEDRDSLMTRFLAKCNDAIRNDAKTRGIELYENVIDGKSRELATALAVRKGANSVEDLTIAQLIELVTPRS